MKCSRCTLELPRGACHVNEAACIDALVESLEKAKNCACCRQPIETPIHPDCLPAELARRGAGKATDYLKGKATEAVLRFLAGAPDPEPEDSEPTREPRKGPDGRKRWRP